MELKHSIHFVLKSTQQIACRLRYSDPRRVGKAVTIEYAIGLYADPLKWSKETESPMRNTTHTHGKRSVTASQIVKRQQRYIDCIEDCIKAFEVRGEFPDADRFKAECEDYLVKEELKAERSTSRGNSLNDIASAFDAWVKEGVELKGWQRATCIKIKSLLNNLKEFRSEFLVSDMTKDFLQAFQVHQLTKHSKRNGKPRSNRSISDDFKLLRGFLRWCKGKGLRVEADAMEYNPKLKDVEGKEVVFLDLQEFLTLYDFHFDTPHLERCRDVFVFQCATGLRYSDMLAMRRTHIKGNHLHVITKKTVHSLNIELNKYALAILHKYEGETFENNSPLPIVSHQKQNDYLKEVCRIVGFDTLIRTCYRSGGKRIEAERPKYELVGTHTARRTFVSIALSLGASSAQVASVTGHHSLRMVEKYVGVSDADRTKATSIWNDDDTAKQKCLDKLKSLSLSTLARLADLTEEELNDKLFK